MFFARCGIAVLSATVSSLMRVTAGGPSFFNVVDVYTGATGAWSTAVLSVGRDSLVAASVGNVALFAGGLNSSALLCSDGVERIVYYCLCFL